MNTSHAISVVGAWGLIGVSGAMAAADGRFCCFASGADLVQMAPATETQVKSSPTVASSGQAGDYRRACEEIFGSLRDAQGQPLKSDDVDRDQIDDIVEHMLLQAYAPTILFGDTGNPPVSVEWWIRHSHLRISGEDPADADRLQSEWDKRRDIWKSDISRFLPELRRLAPTRELRESTRLQVARASFLEGKSDLGVPMGWPEALLKGNVGVYGHVVRDSTPGVFIVQYFVLLTWNQTANAVGIGNHEADWLMTSMFVCVPEYAPKWSDVGGAREHDTIEEWRTRMGPTVLIGADSAQGAARLRSIRSAVLDPEKVRDRLICIRMCNHGRYVDMRGERTKWSGSEHPRPELYAETGTHELWPEAGGEGYLGWPGRLEANKQQDSILSDPTSRPPKGWDEVLNPRRLDNFPNYRDSRNHKGQSVLGFGYEGYFRPAWENREAGYRVSFDFGPGSQWDGLNEQNVVRSHRGEGAKYVTRNIPNLGEIGYAARIEAQIVLDFEGLWGGRWTCNPSPEGPVKKEMWIGHDPGSARPAATVEEWLRRKPSMLR